MKKQIHFLREIIPKFNMVDSISSALYIVKIPYILVYSCHIVIQHLTERIEQSQGVEMVEKVEVVGMIGIIGMAGISFLRKGPASQPDLSFF